LSDRGRLLVTGGSGLVGGSVTFLALEDWDVARTYLRKRPSLAGVEWHRLDITEADLAQEMGSRVEPDLIVNAAALADIDFCQTYPEEAFEVNVLGTRNIARAADSQGAQLVHLSTANVFDGQKGDYLESDETRGVSQYALTKIASEIEALSYPDSVVVRTSIVLGFPRTAGRSFLAKACGKLTSGEALPLPTEEIRTPVDSQALASCILELGSSRHSGAFHIAGTERLSRYVMGLYIADRLGCDRSLVEPVTKPPPGRAPRPRDVSLNTSRARSLLETALPDCRLAIDRALEWAGID
jgi:dTDP-4-dehydrorhamnose reductase